MKKYFCYVMISIINTVTTAQVIFIPDVNFKVKLLAASPINTIAAIGTLVPNTIINVKVDTNDNNEIEVNEVQDITYLNLIGSNISDLTGIEYFNNLKYLLCWQNNLTNLNVSQLVHLERLNCRQNNISSLNISTLINLTVLDFSNNQVSIINFSNNALIEKAFCSNNQLNSLDFSNNPLFNELDCFNNPNLSKIKINNGTLQLLGSQTYYNQCWVGLPNLTTICADANEIDILESYLAACGIETSGISITSNCTLGNEEFAINDVVVYPNPASSNVNITSKNSIKTIELVDVQGRVMCSKLVNDSQATLDIAGYSNGVYFIKVVGDGGSRIEKIIKE